MEEQKPFVIPTMSKAKISHLLSYPVGAETITRALDGVPQLKQMALQFHEGSDYRLRSGRYEFFRVEYLRDVEPLNEYPVYLFRRPLQYRWEILVQPVPRVKRHQIKTYIDESALEMSKDWLVERAHLEEKGNAVLAFFFDDEKNEFAVQRVERLEPAMR